MAKRLVPKQYRFSTPLAAGATARMTVASELSGKIVTVTMHWPTGCNSLVDLAFGRSAVASDEWLCPSTPNTYLALENATPVFKLDADVRRDDILWVEFRNRDGAWPHTPAVIVDVFGWEGPE